MNERRRLVTIRRQKRSVYLSVKWTVQAIISQLSEKHSHRVKFSLASRVSLTQIESIIDFVDLLWFSQRKLIVLRRIQFQNERSDQEKHSNGLRKRKMRHSNRIDLTRRVLSVSPEGRRLMNSTPLKGVVTGGYRRAGSFSKCSIFVGFSRVCRYSSSNMSKNSSCC